MCVLPEQGGPVKAQERGRTCQNWDVPVEPHPGTAHQVVQNAFDSELLYVEVGES